ncbi:unnamed protein product, partial [Closterium sp. Yama58-4]
MSAEEEKIENPAHQEEDDDAPKADDEDTGAHIAPIVKLEEVAVSTGEENENVLFEIKSKLYRFDKEGNQWKERGVGQVKLLEHKDTKKVRLLMRQQKTLKICANHTVLPSMSLQEHAGSDKSWVWHAQDFADGELKKELFTMRFGSPESAQKFKSAFEEAQEKMAAILGTTDAAKEVAKEAEKTAEELEKLAVKKDEEKPAEYRGNTEDSRTCAADPAMSNPVADSQKAGSTAIASALKDVPVERIVGPGNAEVVKIGSFWETQPVVIHFLRRFGCRICRGGAMNMSRAIPHLHKAGVRVVAIGLDHLGVEEFVDGGYWKGELYIDDGKRAYRALQLKSISLWQVAYQLLFDKTVKKSLGDTANVKGDLAGDGLQLGATFLFDKGGRLLHEFRQVTVADHPSPEELLKPFAIDSSVLSGVKEARGSAEEAMAFATRATSCQLRLPANLPLNSASKGPVSVRLPAVRAAAGDVESSGAEKPRMGERQGERAKGIFEFVTDNPSSRSAIQLKNAPAMDGNVGQMISAIEDKGKDMGSYVLSGEFQYFVRQIGNAGDPLVVYLHGAPAQSWGFREVMQQMAEKGYRGIAPDWLGFGFSEKPQPGYYFAYTEDAYHQELDRVLETLNVTEPFYLVVH